MADRALSARNRIRLTAWACRAADMINKVFPARAVHLGSTCDYAREWMGHVCRCGHRPYTWEEVYTDMLERLGEEGPNG